MSSNSAVAYSYDDEYSDAQVLTSDIAKPINFSGVHGRTGDAGEVVHVGEEEDTGEEILPLIYPVKELRNAEYRMTLREPIAIYFEGQEGERFAVHERSGVFGQGENLPAALRDFSNAFIDVYLSYTQSAEPLTVGATKFVDYLRRVVENIEEIHDG